MKDKYPNWFDQYAVDYFSLFLKPFKGNPNLNFLQIGVFTGDATKWLVKNILTGQNSKLTDVDTWTGSYENIHKNFKWDDVELFYDKRIKPYKNVIKYKKYSKDFFIENTEKFDFIYIDGDHTSNGVYDDANYALKCLKVGGLLAFDDFLWEHESRNPKLSPGPGINKFISENIDKVSVLIALNQLWLVKEKN